MGRPQKEKNNYEKRFEQLYEEKRIDGNAGLLRKMYTVYYKGQPDVNTDRQTWVNSQEADFGKKIRGKRAFTESDIKSIERAVGMSWVDIVEPLPEKPKKTKKFEEKGLRYAAYTDEERYYQDLADYNADDFNNVALCNYDEYGKTIVDYIIENKAENGLRFLINKKYLWRRSSLKLGGRAYHTEEHSEELWDWIISIDDPELFLKVWGEEDLFNDSFDHEEKGEKFLEKIIETEKIFEALCCKEYIDPESNVKYMPCLLFEALKFSLNRNEQVIAQRIISAYAKFIDDQTKSFQNEINQESNNKLMAYRFGHSLQSEIRYDKKTVMYVWDVSKLPDKRGGFAEQIECYQISNIINRLKTKDLAAMEYGDSFIKDGIYYIKKKPDISLEALKYLTEERQCKFLPTYMGEENGVTKISAYKNDWYGVKFSELGKMLGEIHSLSREKLGVNRVYMYSGSFANGFGYMISGETKVISKWETCDIGTPVHDIVTAFLNYRYYHQNYERFTEGKRESYAELSQFLDAYPDKGVIENFGDKFNDELDEMLRNVIWGTQGKRTEAIEKLYMAKSFAEIYRDDLNRITMRKCEVESET